MIETPNVEFSGGAAFAPSAGTQGYAQVLTMRQEAQQPKWKDQRVSPLALKLAEEEHDQGNDMKHLLIAQLKLEGQRKHGN